MWQYASDHGPRRVKRESCEENATWTDGAPALLGLSRASRQSRSSRTAWLVQLRGDGIGLQPTFRR